MPNRPGFAPSTTVAALAADHVAAIDAAFGTAVDLLGISTGGAIAQQIAADYPYIVRRLGSIGRSYQRREPRTAAR
jgi:pimeloyl-ACP methyl ester carboxylesterase